jgi:hypothetical protein
MNGMTRGKTILMCAAIAMVVALSSAPRAEACVGCRFRVDCTMYGQDCVLIEYCADLAAPHGGADDCLIDENGCTEIGTCQVARLGTPLDLRQPVEWNTGARALRECSLGRLPGANSSRG